MDYDGLLNSSINERRHLCQIKKNACKTCGETMQLRLVLDGLIDGLFDLSIDRLAN